MRSPPRPGPSFAPRFGARPGLELRPDVFAIWSALVEERSGLHYGPQDRELLEDKLASRALDAGFDSLLDYYYHVRYDDPTGRELEALLDALVVNETYFFRELAPVTATVAHVIAPLVAAGVRPRIWSAACSTGEEPLTLAMLLADRGLLDHVELVASDLSHKALAVAKGGVYPPRAVRKRPDEALADKWLDIEADGRVRVRGRLHERIDFRRINLLDTTAVASLGRFDVIFCRNVLIYFREATVRRLLSALADALSPGGVLVVGVSESLLRFDTSLACEEVGGAFLYRKAGRRA